MNVCMYISVHEFHLCDFLIMYGESVSFFSANIILCHVRSRED